MPRPYPQEFRDDVVRVARNRDDGVTIEQIATDFGVHPVTLHKWMRQADIDEGAKPGKSTSESAELRDARVPSSCTSPTHHAAVGERMTAHTATRQHGVMIGFALGRNAIASFIHRRHQQPTAA
ncbi:transposase [Mycobacterium syngnathidarum]